jgi:hypothetical protein
MTANIMFDSMGAQVQVQNQTGQRLTTWTGALAAAGYTVSYTNWQAAIAPQLEATSTTPLQDVFIVTTHQYTEVPKKGQTPPRIHPNPIPAGTNFGYLPSDLGGILAWVQGGGSLLLFVNHAGFAHQTPFDWPVEDIQLAAALGIPTVFAAIDLSSSTLTPTPGLTGAVGAITSGVSTLQALDSGGIHIHTMAGAVIGGSNLVPLPPGWVDSGPLKYHPDTHLTFAVLHHIGKGHAIVIGHSGIAGDAGSSWPSTGQIGAADNQTFLMNCVSFLASAATAAR